MEKARLEAVFGGFKVNFTGLACAAALLGLGMTQDAGAQGAYCAGLVVRPSCEDPDIDVDGDCDRDGVIDCRDACPLNVTKWKSAGVCGCTQNDKDDDGDGVPVCGTGPGPDLCPNDGAKRVPGNCGCGNSEVPAEDDTVLCNTPPCFLCGDPYDMPVVIKVSPKDVHRGRSTVLLYSRFGNAPFAYQLRYYDTGARRWVRITRNQVTPTVELPWRIELATPNKGQYRFSGKFLPANQGLRRGPSKVATLAFTVRGSTSRGR